MERERVVVPVFVDVVSLEAVVKSETRCFPTPRDVSTGSIVAFCLSNAVTVFGPIVSTKRRIRYLTD